MVVFFFSSRRRHTRCGRDWSSDVCSSDLKVLLDEIFNRDNFLSSIVWQRSYSPINLKKYFSDNHDTIHCYAKNINSLHNFTVSRDQEAKDRYKNPDNDSRGPWTSGDISVGPAVVKNIYPIVTPARSEERRVGKE